MKRSESHCRAAAAAPSLSPAARRRGQPRRRHEPERRRRRPTFDAGTTMADARRGGHDHDRHQVRPAAVRPRRPRRHARGLRRRDRQDHRRQARASRRGQHRVDRDRLGQPRAVHRERPGRHRRRDLHDQRHAQGGHRLRRARTTWPVSDPRARRQRGHQERGGPRRTRRSAPSTGSTSAAQHRRRYGAEPVLTRHLLELPRAPAPRPGRRRHHRQRDPRGPRRPERGRVRGRRRARSPRSPTASASRRMTTTFRNLINDVLEAVLRGRHAGRRRGSTTAGKVLRYVEPPAVDRY